jgi:hypothetical protein
LEAQAFLIDFLYHLHILKADQLTIQVLQGVQGYYLAPDSKEFDNKEEQ